MDAPWSSSNTLAIKDNLKKLSVEILDFEKYIAPTKKEELDRNTLLYSIETMLTKTWPGDATLEAFGSSVTGLLFPSSDLDVNINFIQLPESNIIVILKQIRKYLQSNRINVRHTTRLVASARVPVLMFEDYNGVNMDISIQNECFSSDRTVTFLTEYPVLKHLFMILKPAISAMRVTNSPAFEPMSAKTAGLASYSLVCMIVSYLQLKASALELDPTDPTYLGTLLIGFLRYYAKEFENTKSAIDVRAQGCYVPPTNCPFYKPSDANILSNKLYIIDPDSPTVNVARSTLKFTVIKLLFKTALEALEKKRKNASKTESVLSSIIKVVPHHSLDARKEGDRFKFETTWVSNGPSPKRKDTDNSWADRRRGDASAPYFKGGNRYRDNLYDEYSRGGRDESVERNSRYNNKGSNYHHSRYEDDGDRYYSRNKSRYEGGSSSSGGGGGAIRIRGNNNSKEDNYRKEYEKHKKNGNHHLAEHYRTKSSKK